jgi:hypothetical protein
MDDPSGSNAVLVYSSPPSSPEPIKSPELMILIGSAPEPHEDAIVVQRIESLYGVPAAKIALATKKPGEQHPRIWRGHWYKQPKFEFESIAGAVNSARVLMERFKQVALIVEPHEANRPAFGHEMRHLLVLAAMEVESAWKAILVANNFPRPKNDHYTTREYAALIDPLRLREWKVKLPMYPAYGFIAPFQNWDRERPTASLPWYDTYNETKHDRESNLQKATLENVIAALAGLYVMLCAQWGPPQLRKDPFLIPEFSVQTEPQWGLTEEYVPVVSGKTEIKPVPLTF